MRRLKLWPGGGVIGIPPKSAFLKSNGLRQGSSIDHYIHHIRYVHHRLGGDRLVGMGTDVGDERKYTPGRMATFNSKYPEVAIIDENLRTDVMHTTGLQSPITLHNVTAGLVRSGFAEEGIPQVFGGNFLRVFRQVWGRERQD